MADVALGGPWLVVKCLTVEPKSQTTTVCQLTSTPVVALESRLHSSEISLTSPRMELQ